MAGHDAFGVQLQRGDGDDPEVFTPVARLGDVEGPSTERETHDVTTHDAPDAHREFVGGLKDGGEVSVDVQYDPADHNTLLADYDDTEPRNWRLVWPNNLGEITFAAILTGFQPAGPVDGTMTASLTWKVSGKPTFTAGS